MGPDDRLFPQEPPVVVRIDRRFCGPPDSGNGGYVAGLLARDLGSSDCVVTLKVPPPLERDLVIRSDGSSAALCDGETVIASAERAAVSVDVPAAPSLADAQAAEQRYSGRHDHIFPTCFVCGPDRHEGDGLRIFPGAVGEQVAAVWTPDASLLDDSGAIRPEFIWAALDCPGYFAIEQTAAPAVLGRFAVHLYEQDIGPKPLIVTGWPIRSEGRKHEAGTALHDAQGRLLAAAHATWITLNT